MEAFTTLTAVAAPIDRDNIDTDQLLPPRFLLKRRSDPAYPTFLFHDQRFGEQGQPRPDFVLNRAPYREARIIVASQNFGGGSSREAAAIALQAYGIRCVVAVSFGDIFYNNCIKNGILPVRLPAPVAAGLRAQLQAAPGATLTVDLREQCVIDTRGAREPFEIDGFSRQCLLEGLSAIDLTLQHRATIDAFEQKYRTSFPWT
ncbi:3-isopropylmalate dehydratase small subunit [Ramlibacter sp.]|uniref:3-isopropylmalate dehydratase small subunit n=1 Tax=Ramlibacter sp. TaxID=1917967 RepID=UPI003D12741B